MASSGLLALRENASLTGVGLSVAIRMVAARSAALRGCGVRHPAARSAFVASGGGGGRRGAG
jgi:hypothetical protein